MNNQGFVCLLLGVKNAGELLMGMMRWVQGPDGGRCDAFHLRDSGSVISSALASGPMVKGWTGPPQPGWLPKPLHNGPCPNQHRKYLLPMKPSVVETLHLLKNHSAKRAFCLHSNLVYPGASIFYETAFHFAPSLLRAITSHWIVLCTSIFNLVKVFFFFPWPMLSS